MRAGTLNKLIDIFKRIEITNEYNEKSWEYEKLKTIRGELEWKSGTRDIENDEIFHPTTKKLYVRIYQPICDEDKLVFDGNEWRVISVEVDDKFQRKVITLDKINE